MSPLHLINCLNYNNIFTGFATGASGSLAGAYDLNSGSGTNLIYNLIYNTGSHFNQGSIAGNVYPLVSVGNPFSGYRFSGVNSVRIPEISGDFSFFTYIDYSGCLRNTTGTSFVLLSSQDDATGSGTFFLGINDYNRLFFQSSGYSKTLPYELKDKNLIYFGLGAQKYVNFGVFDLLNNNFVSESFSLDVPQKDVNKVYLGGFLNNNNLNYTGYFGKINDFLYFNEPLTLEALKTCSDCLFSTGQFTGSAPVTSAYFSSITGYLLSGVNENVITGFVSYTGNVQKSDGSLIPIVFLSGVNQVQQTEEVATLLTGVSLVRITGRTPQIFIKDTGKINGFSRFHIEFDQILTSGDTLEIHTYPQINQFVNNQIINLEFPVGNYVQLIGNGLVETNGVDYQVDRGFISGFFEDDILFYDVLTGSGLVTSFSGYWAEDKVSMSGGSFYPPSSQFLEKSGLIFISGISGQPITSNYDVYMDGQKLNSGYNYYFSGISGTNYTVLNPAYVPRLIAYPIYPTTGGLPTGISDVEDAELSLLPNYGLHNRYYYDITGNTSVIPNITGFSERIWLNGIRQRKLIDYLRVFSCTLNSGVNEWENLSFNFYNNTTGLWNVD